jgi:nicotinamidase-related amidase
LPGARKRASGIVLGGIATNIGVESTARSAAEHGYELVIPEDLCGGLSDEMHAFSFKHIFPRLAPGQPLGSDRLRVV